MATRWIFKSFTYLFIEKKKQIGVNNESPSKTAKNNFATDLIRLTALVYLTFYFNLKTAI